jgi:cbb3-type cytochrome oxidase cytochrome c subunit
MENISLILSIIASIGTIISIIFNFKLKDEIKSLKQVKGHKNIQSTGANSINNTGDNNTFSR